MFPIPTLKDLRANIVIVLFFILSRLMLHYFYELEFIQYNLIHLLDIEWIQYSFFQSMLYNHSQPPIFNLFFGISEMIFNKYSPQFYSLFFQILSISTALLGYKILRLINVNKKLSIIIILFYLFTPATFLYEKFFFYTQIIIFFLVLGGYNLLLYSQRNTKLSLITYFLSIAFVSLTASFFHLSWTLVMFAIPIIFFKNRRLTIIKFTLIPLLLVLSLYIKNYILFEQFSVSSWAGINFARITLKNLDQDFKEKLVSENKISKASLFNGFPNERVFPNLEALYDVKKTGIRVLDEKYKSNGKLNYNNRIFILLSNDLIKDDFFVVKNFPEVYLMGIKEAFLLYFHSPTKYPWIEFNTNKIFIYNKFFDSFIYGAGRYTKTGIITIFLYPIILIISFFILVKVSKSSFSKLFITYALINILYVMLIGNLLELGENNRFRLYTEIFYYILIGKIIQITISRVFSKKIS